MEIPLLITRTDIAQVRQISESIYDDVLNSAIKETQFLDLQPLLGPNMYNDLLRNYTDVKYTTLLDGGTYTYNAITYTNIGLKVVLAHYTYARHAKFGSVVDTPFSLVEKTTENSQPVSEKSKQVLFKGNQQIAYRYWVNVEAFLDRNKATYPLWLKDCSAVSKTFRLSKIN